LELLAPNLSSEAIIRGVKHVFVLQPLSVSVNGGRRAGLFQGQDSGIRSRDYSGSAPS